MSVAANLAGVEARIAAACARSGRARDDVTLVGVIKGVAPQRVREAWQAGLRDFGENFVQEARATRSQIADIDATWHFIGHLQTNKAAEATELFDIIESVDSLRLAQTLDRRLTRPMRVLLEVNVAEETSKFGFRPAEVADAVRAMSSLDNLQLTGLMTIAPAYANPQDSRAVFAGLRQLANDNGLRDVSMGMTNDFEVAIEEGATIVRIGRAIFGERN